MTLHTRSRLISILLLVPWGASAVTVLKYDVHPGLFLASMAALILILLLNSLIVGKLWRTQQQLGLLLWAVEPKDMAHTMLVRLKAEAATLVQLFDEETLLQKKSGSPDGDRALDKHRQKVSAAKEEYLWYREQVELFITENNKGIRRFRLPSEYAKVKDMDTETFLKELVWS